MHFIKNQKGTGMTEVCCMLALIAVAAAASLGYLGNAVEKKFTDQAELLANKSAGGDIGDTTGEDPRPAATRTNPRSLP